MKAVLSLENRTIIPNIKFNNPNPASKIHYISMDALGTFAYDYSTVEESQVGSSGGTKPLA
jgi:hypothetical protein